MKRQRFLDGWPVAEGDTPHAVARRHEPDGALGRQHARTVQENRARDRGRPGLRCRFAVVRGRRVRDRQPTRLGPDPEKREWQWQRPYPTSRLTKPKIINHKAETVLRPGLGALEPETSLPK